MSDAEHLIGDEDNSNSPKAPATDDDQKEATAAAINHADGALKNLNLASASALRAPQAIDTDTGVHLDPCGTAVDERYARDGDGPPEGLRLLCANFVQLLKCLVVRYTTPVNERHGGLPMRQLGGQAPAASEVRNPAAHRRRIIRRRLLVTHPKLSASCIALEAASHASATTAGTTPRFNRLSPTSHRISAKPVYCLPPTSHRSAPDFVTHMFNATAAKKNRFLLQFIGLSCLP